MNVQGGLQMRRMLPEDLEKVLQIQTELAFQEWNSSHFLCEINNEKDSFPLVLEIDTIICGYLVFKVMGDEAELCSIAIGKSMQGRGLAFSLLGYGLGLLRARGIGRVFLEVRRGNIPAQALYGKMGFKEVGVRKRYYPDGEDALAMVLGYAVDC